MPEVRAVVVALSLLLGGCALTPEKDTEIDRSQRPADWPALVQDINVVSPEALRQACSVATMAAGRYPIACAKPDFCTRRCAMWFTARSYVPYIINHERYHCEGYDHPGGSAMRDAWERAKRRACPR